MVKVEIGPAQTKAKPPYDFSDNYDVIRAMLKRNENMKTERSPFFTHALELGKYLMPRTFKQFIGDVNQTTASDWNSILDNTGTRALHSLESGLMSGTTNPSRPWFGLATADPDLNRFWPVRAWLDDATERMLRVFARTNTYRSLHQMYGELALFGTAASMVLPDFGNVIHHYPVVAGSYCIARDYQGNVVTIYREMQKSVAETVKEFGLKNCSNRVQTLWSNRELESTVDILHAIEPRDDQERDPSNPSARNMPWRSTYIEKGDNETRNFLRDSGFTRFPALTPRWSVYGDDVYGISPAMEALGDVKQLQHQQMEKGRAISLQARPPVQVPTTLKDRESRMFPGGIGYFKPGTTIPFDQATPHGGVRTAFETKLDLSALLPDIMDVRDRINSAFFADLFLALTLRSDTTQKTAAEVAVLDNERLIALGPVLDRLQNEVQQPLIETTFETMLERGLLPPPPPELQDQAIDVKFTSILAQAQEAAGLQSIDRFMGNILTVAGTQPDVLDKVNFDRYADEYATRVGVPAEMIVDDETVRQLREKRAEAEAAIAQTEMAKQQAGAFRDMASVPADQVDQSVIAEVLG